MKIVKVCDSIEIPILTVDSCQDINSLSSSYLGSFSGSLFTFLKSAIFHFSSHKSSYKQLQVDR